MWTYIKNLTTQAASRSTTPPWQTTSPTGVPSNLDKKSYRVWCADPKTDHVFFSAVEAVNHNVRPSAGNLPHLVHGFVGDYDSDHLVNMTDQEIRDEITKRTAGKGIQPNHMSRTFSNKLRLVWEFESPIPGNIPAALKKSLELFVKESKANVMIEHGLDECSLDPTQMFEMGHGWYDFGNPKVPSATLQAIYFKAASTTVTQAETSTLIPMDVIADEIERQYPGALNGIQFGNGVRVPLFWLRDNNPSRDAQVGENGIWSYSTNRDFGMHTWGELLGKAFVKDYETQQIGDAVDAFVFDGNNYWLKLPNGRWYAHKKEDAQLHMEFMGFSTKTDKAGMSPAKKLFHHIHQTKRVDNVAPFLFNPSPIVEHGSRLYLNTNIAEAMLPVGTGQSDPTLYWPFIHEYLMDFLDPDPAYDIEPIHYLLSWMKYFWESALDHDPQPGQLVVIAGGKDAGKTLFGKHILGPMMGGSEDATKFILGDTEFNRDQIHKAVWRIDDSAPPESESTHSKYSDKMKALVANMECPFRAMYRDNVTVPWLGRIYLTCNLNSDAQGILPKLSETMLDKVMLFKASNRKPGFFPPKAIVEATIASELPFFLEWLKNDYVIPQGVIPQSNRFGIAPYHHHEIVRTVRQMSPEQNLADLLAIWAKEKLILEPEVRSWSGNPTQLMHELFKMDTHWKNMPRDAKHAGMSLKKLRENKHWRISWSNAKNANVYTISLEPEPGE